MEDAEEDNGSAVAEVIDSEPIWGQPSSEARQLATNIQNLDPAAKARLKKASMLLRNSESEAFRDDCIELMEKVWVSEKKRRIGTGEEEKGTAQRGSDTLSPLDKIVKCWDALREPKLCYLHEMLPDVPAEYLDRLDAFWDGDIPDDVYLELRAEPWTLPELPSP
jgi:hypothetical protein